MTIPPSYTSIERRAEWLSGYEAEQIAISVDGYKARTAAFRVDFPPPWSGDVDPRSFGRYAALCDFSRTAKWS